VVERPGTAQPGGEKAQGDLISGSKYLKSVRVQKTEPDSSQWHSVKGQEAIGTN